MRRNKGEWLQLAAFVFDLTAVAVSWATAYLLRFEFVVPAPFAKTGLGMIGLVLPAYGAMFWSFGLYRGLWLFASLPDLIRIIKAIAAGAALSLALVVVVHPVPSVPRSVLFMTPIFLLCIMGGARAAYRATKEFYRYGGLLAQGKPVLIVGAGGAAALLARRSRQAGSGPEWHADRRAHLRAAALCPGAKGRSCDRGDPIGPDRASEGSVCALYPQSDQGDGPAGPDGLR
jgi:FlaA1/EpsC-like NDP-sugar epimerase